MEDKISILIPTYNRASMLPLALDSIMSQTYGNLEIIIYDDGSVDNTIEILNKYSQRDPRIKTIYSKENRGCAYARNQMLNVATGKYACWQDSDDWSNIYRMQMQYSMIREGRIMVATEAARLHKPNAEWKCKPQRLQQKGRDCHASVMFEMAKAIEVPIRRSVGGSDADWLRGMKADYKLYCVDAILYYIRDHVDRIGIWKRKPNANPQWYNRMEKYARRG